MKIGRFEIEQLSEGVFEGFTDGTFKKINADKIRATRAGATHKKYSTLLGIDPILIRDGKHNILIDTGLGWGLDYNSQYTNTSNLATNLDIFGLTPSDITHVIFTHLHFDHIAGATYVDENLSTRATMPYANHFVQKKEWHYALQQVTEPNPSGQYSGYNLDEFYRLIADDKVVFITDAYYELLPGIDIIRTGGHTPGHQIVKIHDARETAYFLGDLIPSEYHLNHYSTHNIDVDPIQTNKAKILLLRQALDEKAVLLFYHSIHNKSGIIEHDEYLQFVLKKIPE